MTARLPWTQHLDVADGMEAKPLGDACLHQFDNAADSGLRIIRLHEVELAGGALALGRSQRTGSHG